MAKKITVELVKYDTEKTKKRKRKDLLVDAKSESAVVDKLEKIHKGDKVQAIYEIIWAEDDSSEDFEAELFTGIIKFFDKEKGFGFIEPDVDMDDLFFHASALGGKDVYDQELVEFEVSEGPKGLIAIHIKVINN